MRVAFRLLPRLKKVGGVIPTGLLVNDTFTDTDGVFLNAHTPDLAPAGSSWTYNQYTKISGNTVKAVGGYYAGGGIVAGAYNVRVTFSCANSAGSNVGSQDCGVGLRRSGSYSYRVEFNTIGKVFRISEHDGTTFTIRASVSIPTLTAATLYTIVATVQGTTITATLDGANQISYDQATLNPLATTHSLYLYKSNVDYGDNYSIEGL